MPTYSYPNTFRFEKIERLLMPKKALDSPLISKVMPITSDDDFYLVWERGDVLTGVQQWRGLNNKPLTVNRKGVNQYIALPGVYGEKQALREDELTKRRAKQALAGGAGPINITDLVSEAHEQLLDRRLNLIEKIISDLLIAGSFTVADSDGATVYRGSFTRQQITPSVEWDVPATATPLKDMRGYRELELGRNVVFNSSGVQIMTSATWAVLMANTNTADLGGKLVNGGNTLNSIDDLNRIFLANDIPPIVIYNGGYYNDAGTFVKFITDGKVLVVGKRSSGTKIGEYRITRNLNAPNAAAAPYVRVKTDDDVPSVVEVHDGHNGGPVVQYPEAMILVNAYT